MCTTISDKATVAGSGKGASGWFELDHVYVGYDHPFHAQFDHALSIDFVNEAAGPGSRVAVELDRESARTLANRILATLDLADAYEDGAPS
ncbi:MAG TPA: DUF6295 family protein [Jiangellaceae bacterium]